MSGKDIHKYHIKIRDSGKYGIWYSHGQFRAYSDDKEVATAKTEEELKEKLKAFEASKRKFKPLRVIKVDNNKEGKLTSRDAQMPDDHVVFSYESSGKSYHGKKCYGHTSVLVQRYNGDYAFVEATQNNLMILSEIKLKKEQISLLNNGIDKLKETYEKPVTFERLDELAGEDK